jgi:trk system potassium uptake protein
VALLRNIRPGQIVLLAFAVAILIGTVLLMLPVSRAGEGGAPWVTALFTSTSSVCVTGHVVVDTPTYWSTFGQVVILALVQIGGFGIVAAGSLIVLVVGRRLGLRGRLLTQSESQALSPVDVRRVLAGIGVLTLAVEVVAAAVLTARFHRGYDLPLGDALWRGVFHAVSAYNNAGFALQSDNLVAFATDGWVILTIGLAVIAGGLGYPVFVDLVRRRADTRRWTLHTKITLLGTVLLLAGGWLLFALLEWDNGDTLGEMGAGSRVMNAWFQSVTTRTAGFNAIDISAMRDESWLVADMLMFVGGGSGSTAGGIKVGTLVVLFLIVLGEARGGRTAEIFRRSIPVATQRQALSVAFLGFTSVTVATIALMILTPFPLARCLFEVISAFGTVGLSTGITADLGDPGQLILVALMYLGRIGPLALVVALAVRERERLFTYPEERPLVG